MKKTSPMMKLINFKSIFCFQLKTLCVWMISTETRWYSISLTTMPESMQSSMQLSVTKSPSTNEVSISSKSCVPDQKTTFLPTLSLLTISLKFLTKSITPAFQVILLSLTLMSSMPHFQEHKIKKISNRWELSLRKRVA